MMVYAAVKHAPFGLRVRDMTTAINLLNHHFTKPFLLFKKTVSKNQVIYKFTNHIIAQDHYFRGRVNINSIYYTTFQNFFVSLFLIPLPIK